MISVLFLIVVGFILLLKGADWLVDGSSSIARKLKVTQLVVGLTVVAFGTSAPELFVNIFSSINGKADIAIGNILGSNIVNILLILGISAVIYPLSLKQSTVRKEIPLSFLAIIVFVLLANGEFVNNSFSGLTRIDGLVLVAFFLFFLYYIFALSKEKVETFGAEIRLYSLPRSLMLIVFGLAGLLLGGKWIVGSAVAIGSILGISEAVIALTVVAVGTSLPELATSAVAAYKGRADIAVGNIVGSNIFNIFWILGISAIIRPLPFSKILFFDAGVVIFATLLLYLFMFVGKRHILERWQGIVFILLYIGYIVLLVLR